MAAAQSQRLVPGMLRESRLAHRAGVQPDQAIQRAEAHRARGERDHPDPAPWADYIRAARPTSVRPPSTRRVRSMPPTLNFMVISSWRG